ncbi:MAG TPA: non-homologous end-joining DNA ligase, partial [Chryseolinea sp.]|nr:non-homologous end-joining DNA ligase [Chryseolinea sp.]
MKLNRAGNGTKFSADLESRPLSVRSSVARKRKFTEFIKPMLATLTDEPFDHADWIFELKWDGYRAVAEVDGRSVKLYSRNGLSFSELYPKVADALAGLNSHFVLDGEIVVLDENGKPSFQKLQQFSNYPSLKIVYYVFDCLSYQGKDLKDLPLLERKKILRHALVENEVVKYSDHIERAGISFFKKAVKMNLEGVMAKHANSLYDLGRRTGNWLKIKNHNSNEAVIAGYTSPRASRQYFGALILGIFVKGTIKYIGHTGTGFTDSILKDLHRKMQPLVRKRSPFDETIPVNTSVTWLVPKLVCNVKFTELTNDGLMRHPVFMGLRIDKKAKEVNHVESKMKATRKTPAKVKKATGKTGG